LAPIPEEFVHTLAELPEEELYRMMEERMDSRILRS
jgi:hypothetical protein